MNAEEARKLSQEAMQSDVLGPALAAAMAAIERACKNGERSCCPLVGLRLHLKLGAQNALWAELERQGYTVTRHAGDIREPPYVEVSW